MVSLILCTEPRDFRKMRHAGPSASASDIPNFPTTNLISTDADAMMVEPVVAPDLSKVDVLPKKLDTNQPDRYTILSFLLIIFMNMNKEFQSH